MEKKTKTPKGPNPFAERVRSRRAQLGLSQKAVAGLAKISQPSLSAIENGETSWSDLKAPTALGLARALGMTVEQIAGVAPVKEQPPPGALPPDQEKLVSDYISLPEDLRELVLANASQLREYFERIPPSVRANFGRPKDPERNRSWEKDIEADMLAMGIKKVEPEEDTLKQIDRATATRKAALEKAGKLSSK